MHVPLTRLLKRIKSITITLELDNGETITKTSTKKEVNNIPGLSAGIHGMGSILGFIESNALYKWYCNNPKKETELQKAVKSGNVRLSSSPDALEDSDGTFYITEYNQKYKRVKYSYESREDLKEDFYYCKNILTK